MRTRAVKVAIVLGTLGLLVVAFLPGLPAIGGYKKTYFDVANGRLMTEWTVCGCTRRGIIEETSYSELLRKYGFDELPPVWKEAWATSVGLKKISGTVFIDSAYGRVAADAMQFALGMELMLMDDNDPPEMRFEKARRRIAEFRRLVMSGTPAEVRDYVLSFLKEREEYEKKAKAGTEGG
jgi:hypothetical protein